ncbi:MULTISPECIES: DUF4124 domain-containing protein [Pseudomonas]|uniref:DUF4124 domain-containing protein n=1 Tax=Pseudomonas straminea TaxID=47882 RepID=A0A1I1YD42_PSEOC|nr:MULTISPECIES: DUF4124 domain-containing protein [Pseudomonas]MBV7562867.1 DUF4124 domain-containing protein [Pseudomonas sp. sia0905]GLX15700.1 hypothetical protein Pstr01_39390 [Pseudomonas straminea]SFE17517.1 hypothetical protein SAMN05216372_110132 [Pseudomonas straminea]
MSTSPLLRSTLWLGLLLPLWANAAEMYRYTNAQGITVIDRQGVPSEFIAKGYEVLNEQGRVIRVVPPAPTAEEMQKILADRERAKSDAQLLRLYSSLEDVDRAQARKLAELDGLIGVAKGNLQSVRQQQANLQKQAADQERTGREVPKQLLDQISSQRDEQVRLKKDIERYQAARAQAQSAFTADRTRVSELLGQGN